MASVMVWYADGDMQMVEVAPRQYEDGTYAEIGACWLRKEVVKGRAVLAIGGFALSRGAYPADLTAIEIMQAMEDVEGMARITVNGEQVWPLPRFGSDGGEG